jgi:peptidoglycan hydrolase CwlO-like protein
MRLARFISIAAVVYALMLAVGSAWPPRAPAASSTAEDIGALQSGIASDTRRLARVSGSIARVQRNLAVIESDLSEKRAQLHATQLILRATRAQLVHLQVQLAQADQALASNLVARYESDVPDTMTVVLESNGFADMLERLDFMRRAKDQFVEVINTDKRAREHVLAAAQRLAQEESRQQQLENGVLQRYRDIDSIRVALLTHKLAIERARTTKAKRLASLRTRLQAELARLSAAQARLNAPTPGLANDGAYGFFPAPGTNYSVGREPELAARLSALGKAVRLHLIGISGYRSPQHSVEVGGFANDPHTRGEASDTPGVEGVPEATLERFGLTRPFPGPAEADHIQLLA